MTELSDAVMGADGTLDLYLKTADGRVTTVRLAEHAQTLVLNTLLGSSADPRDPRSRRFAPAELPRFRMAEDVGVSFLFAPGVGVHFVLQRSLAAELQELLATFDDTAS